MSPSLVEAIAPIHKPRILSGQAPFKPAQLYSSCFPDEGDFQRLEICREFQARLNFPISKTIAVSSVSLSAQSIGQVDLLQGAELNQVTISLVQPPVDIIPIDFQNKSDVIQPAHLPLFTKLLSTSDLFTALLDNRETLPYPISIEESQVTRDLFLPITANQVLGKKYLREEWSEPFNEKKVLPRPKKQDEDVKVLSSKRTYEKGKTIKTVDQFKWSTDFFDLIWYVLLPPPSLKTDFEGFIPAGKKLRTPYQTEGVERLAKNTSFLLADEMGTGKTVQATTAMRILFRQGEIRSCLILCPRMVLNVWMDHLRDWSMGELLCVKVRGQVRERSLMWKAGFHVFVTTYDTYRSDLIENRIPKIFDLIIFDEAQCIKNRKSERFRALKKTAAVRKWALTGTPIENSIEDVKSIFDILKPGLIHFNETNPNAVKRAITPYMLRRLKKDVIKDLPEKIRELIWLELTDTQRKEYDAVYTQRRTELSELYNKGVLTKQHIFAVITSLKQICNFSMATGSLDSSKAEAAEELCEIIENSNSKVIVFSQFIEQGIEKLTHVFKRKKLARLTGDMTDAQRNENIERFRKNPDTNILLASIKTGGLGITLTEASYVIHFDHWWNPAIMRQAEDRVHRMGQKKKIVIYEFWVKDTYEERIYSMLEEKRLLAEQVIDSLAVPVDIAQQIEDKIDVEDWLEKVFEMKMPRSSTKPKSTPDLKTFQSAFSIYEILNLIKSCNPIEFENFSGEIIRQMGYPHVENTAKTNDGGIDLIAWRDTQIEREYIIVQCKRYTTQGVGVSIVRDLAGVLSHLSTVKKGIIITTTDFTSQSKQFAAESSGKIELINGLELAALVMRYRIIPNPKQR